MTKIKEDIISKTEEGTLTEHRYDNLELKTSRERACDRKSSALSDKSLERIRWLCVGDNDNRSIL